MCPITMHVLYSYVGGRKAMKGNLFYIGFEAPIDYSKLKCIHSAYTVQINPQHNLISAILVLNKKDTNRKLFETPHK